MNTKTEISITGARLKASERRPLRILLIQPFASAVSGVDSVLLHLIKGIGAHDPSFHFTVIIPPGGSINKQRFLQAGADVFEVNLSVFIKTRSPFELTQILSRFLSSYQKLRKIILENQIDIVHSHKINVVVGDFAAFSLGVPVVHTYHEVNTGGLWIYRAFSRIIEPLVDRLIVICDATGRLIASDWHEHPKVNKIHNGIDLDQFSLQTARPDAARSSLRLPKGVPIIAAISRIQNTKGIEHYVDAATIVLRKRPEIHFLMVGDVITQIPKYLKYKNKLMRRVRHRGIDANFHFTGVRNDVADIYAMASVFVLPSVFDVFPTTILEAMAMERPIVATRVGGVIEQVVNGQTGLLVPPGDATSLACAILELLDNPERARQLGVHGRRRVLDCFSLNQYAERTAEIYRQIAFEGQPDYSRRHRSFSPTNLLRCVLKIAS